MRMGAWLVVGLVSSSCAVHRFECEKHGGSAMLRIDSEHFSVTSDLPASDLRVEVRRLERLWDAFAVFLQHDPPPGERLRIVLSQANIAGEFVPDAAGFVTWGLNPLMLTTVIGKSSNRTWSTNAHELVHVMSRHSLPNQPRWIAEGLAEYLGDARFASEYVVKFGRWAWDDGPVEPLASLWAWDEARGNRDEEHSHYQSAWAWIHYLAGREPVRLARLWTALSSGVPPRDAFEAIFSRKESDELRDKVQRYVDEGSYTGWNAQLSRDPILSDPVGVSPWEVHLLRRDLADATGWGALAKAESAKAREVAPSPEPFAVTLAVATDTLSGPRRTDVLLKVAEAQPIEPLVTLELGLAVDASPSARLDSLQKAAAALPNSARAHLALARLALELNEPSALGSAERTVALSPWSVEARLLQVQALAQASRCPEAWAVVKAAQGLAVESASSEAPQVAAIRTKLLESCKESP